MYESSETNCGCATHHQTAGFSLTTLISSVFARLTSRDHVRLSADDLPDDLRRDIGLGRYEAEGSFEERWQAELRNMRR
ncbi:hypothetical protein [Roseibium sp. M-1]